jgi:hypothetical protein
MFDPLIDCHLLKNDLVACVNDIRFEERKYPLRLLYSFMRNGR